MKMNKFYFQIKHLMSSAGLEQQKMISAHVGRPKQLKLLPDRTEMVATATSHANVEQSSP